MLTTRHVAPPSLERWIRKPVAVLSAVQVTRTVVLPAGVAVTLEAGVGGGGGGGGGGASVVAQTLMENVE